MGTEFRGPHLSHPPFKAGSMQSPISQALSSITLGTPVVFETITMFPLVGTPAVERKPSYLTLDEAIEHACAEVTEISDQGSVPELRVTNKGTKPVFIMDGEELVGAKQNRVVNLSILVPATSNIVMPVSCVEAGRWRARSKAFSSAPRAQYSAGRARRMAQVTVSMRMDKSYSADQADVWADISAKAARMGAHSPTSAMEKIFTAHADFTERCVEQLRPVERQCGALFLIDGVVVGLDLFDSAITLRRLLPKLVRGVAVDALDRSPEQRPTVRAEHFLEQVCEAPVHTAAAIGEGEDIRFVHPKIAGGALATGNGVVHVSALLLH